VPLAVVGVFMGTTAAFGSGHLATRTTTPSDVVATPSGVPSVEPTEAVEPAEAVETHSAAPSETSERHPSSSPAARASAGSAPGENTVTPTLSEAADSVDSSEQGDDNGTDAAGTPDDSTAPFAPGDAIAPTTATTGDSRGGGSGGAGSDD